MPPSPVPAALDAHDHIAVAVAQRDPAAAEAAMHAALSEVREALRLSGGAGAA